MPRRKPTKPKMMDRIRSHSEKRRIEVSTIQTKREPTDRKRATETTKAEEKEEETESTSQEATTEEMVSIEEIGAQEGRMTGKRRMTEAILLWSLQVRREESSTRTRGESWKTMVS